MKRTLTLNIPFVEAKNRGSKQRPTAILVRLSDTTSETGAALGVANYWHVSKTSPLTCHYVVDETSWYQCVPDNLIAYPYPYSKNYKNSISVNICAQPQVYLNAWNETTRHEAFQRAAQLVAHLAFNNRIKVRYLDDKARDRWYKRKWRSRGGIILTVKGAFPKDEFLDSVGFYIKELRRK